MKTNVKQQESDEFTIVRAGYVNKRVEGYNSLKHIDANVSRSYSCVSGSSYRFWVMLPGQFLISNLIVLVRRQKNAVREGL